MGKFRNTLSPNGIVSPTRMKAVAVGEASKQPTLGLARLQRLLKTHQPKICVIRGEGIGDVIMTLPSIAQLKREFESCHLTYATNTKYLDGSLVGVLQHNPDIDAIVDRNDIDQEKYDLVVNLHCPCIHYEVPGNPPINRIDLFAKHIGLELQDPVPKFYIQEDELEKARKLLGPLLNEKTILVQPSASNQRRSIDHSKLKEALIELYRNHGYRSIVLTHTSDFRTNTRWNNVSGFCELKNLKIREIAAVMHYTNLVLCPDSSILHLAGAIDHPAVGLFGPTHPDARVNHYRKSVAIWGGRGMGPCPCWYQSCSLRELCWKKITIKDIVDTCVNHVTNVEQGEAIKSGSLIYTEVL